MIRISIFLRTTKKDGVIKLRFRLRDGRQIDLYHKSEIVADLKSLAKFTPEGEPKPKVTVYDKELYDQISVEIGAMRKAYTAMKERGEELTGASFETEIERILHPERVARQETRTLLTRFERYINDGYRSNRFGTARQRHYTVVYDEVARFLKINNIEDIAPDDFSAEHIRMFSEFLRDEYVYVERWPHLYANMSERNTPKERKSQNTVATKMKNLQAFFNELEDTEEIPKSPFRKMGKTNRRNVLKEQYDEPVYLYQTEFLKVMSTDVPDSLKETKDVFLLQCAFGCRIGDFQALNMGKVAVSSDGVPYIHYLPKKTMKEQRDHSEIETPIMRYALDTIKKYEFKFPILKYVSGKSGYNAKIKQLLQFCEIDRLCTVFDEELGDNTYKPLYELGSSKLCRKTHVDMMSKVQVNQYAAGLHREGSDAVKRYTRLELRDRFLLMCAAFNQPQYKVNHKLEIVEE